MGGVFQGASVEGGRGEERGVIDKDSVLPFYYYSKILHIDPSAHLFAHAVVTGGALVQSALLHIPQFPEANVAASIVRGLFHRAP
jgi:hypothetical protein